MKNGGQGSEKITLDMINADIFRRDEASRPKSGISHLSIETAKAELSHSAAKKSQKEAPSKTEAIGAKEVADKEEKKGGEDKQNSSSSKKKKSPGKVKQFWLKIWTVIKRFIKKINIKTVIIFVAVLLSFNIIVQMFYPLSMMLPATAIAGRDFSFANKNNVIEELNEAYSNASIDLLFGENELPHSSVKPTDIGLIVDVSKDVDALNYPWYMRLVPTSIFWYGALKSANIQPELNFNETALNAFIIDKFGANCSIAPENASLAFDGQNLKLKKAKYGGTCKTDDVRAAIKNLNFDSIEHANVRIPIDEIAPDVTNKDAKELASVLGAKLLNNLNLQIEDDERAGSVEVPVEELIKWIEFEVVDKKLTVVVSDTKSADFFNQQVAPLVSQAAGVSVVTANNLGDIEHNEGAKGKMINVKETNQRIADWLMDKRTSVVIAIESINPEVQFTRRFDSSSEGLTALISYFTQTHDGKYGVQVLEIGGKNRQASYYADREFSVGGAARFLIGYGLLSVDGNQSDTCFDSVMRSYDTKCVDRTVFSWLLQNRVAMDMTNTITTSEEVKTTARDLATLLANLYTGNSGLNEGSRNKILRGLQTSEPRNGIASLGSNVFSSVGEQGQQYSDVVLTTANGHPYVLAVLTENAQKSDVIELAKKINELMGN